MSLGCSSSSRNTTACEVGASAPCRDADGWTGVRLCQPNGELGPCQCNTDAGPGGSGGSAGSGGSSGSSGGASGTDSGAGSRGSAGTGGSSGSASWPSGRGARMVVATAPGGSFCIGATETTVLGERFGEGQIVRLPKSGGSLQVLADPVTTPEPLVSDGTALFWGEYSSIARMALGGGQVHT